MIEKLDSKMDCVEIAVLGKHTECLGFDSAKEIGKKLNELVDAVNDITDWIKRTDETIVKYGIKPIPEKIVQGFKNLQNPYAEQRKWIGKLCWFWEYDDSKPFADLLSSIDDTDNEFPYYSKNNGYWCKKCEPVKPDSELIYHGE